MPSLKDKYSDVELDPVDKAFNEMTARPDMKALDDQGNAAARELGRAEKTIQPSNTVNGDRKGDDATRDAESDPAELQNTGLYRPGNKQARAQRPAWSRRRKTSVFGIGGGLVGLMIAAAFALLPMKLVGIMDTIISDTGQRVEYLTEKRAKLIVGRAILSKFGTHTGIVLTGEGAFKTLVASMRTSGFEKRLAAKGLTIDTTPDGVKLTYKGESLGGGKTFKNEKDIIDALDRNKLTNKMLKDVIKEDIPSWRWMKRARFAKWLRIKYDIPRYGILNNSSETDDKKRASEMQKGRLAGMYARTVKNALNAFDCILGSSCVADNLNGSTKGDINTSDAGDEFGAAIKDAGETVTEESSKNPFKAVIERITQTLIGKIGTKLIPIIGQIDLVATLDHIAYEALENDYFAKIPAYFRSLQYAQMFGEWSGYSDQQKLGALDHVMNGPLANQLDGAETAQAFNYIEGDPSKGVPVKLKIDSNDPSKYKGFWEEYKNTLGNIPGTPGGKTSHFFLNIFYETLGGGGLLGWISAETGEIIGELIDYFTPESFQAWLEEAVKKGIGKVLDYFGLTIDPLDTGPDLFNNLHAGGTVSFNDYCKEIGCRKLSPEQANNVNSQIAMERAADLKDKGVFYAMLSPENTKSLTTKLAISLPSPRNTDVSTIATKLGSLISSAPSNLFSLMIPNATATTHYVDLYGTDAYGGTEGDLNQPLSSEFIEGEECPSVAEGGFNRCKIDTEIANAMFCEFDPEHEDCLDEDQPTSSTSTLGDMRVATYNVKVPGQTDAPNDGWLDSSVRMPMIAKIVKANDFRVIGFQEVEPSTFRMLSENMPEYDSYPKNAQSAVGQSWMDPIFWAKDDFTLVDKGEFKRSYRMCPGVELCEDAVWVRLRHKEGGDFYFMSLHMVNRNPYVGPNKSDDGGAEKREADSKEVVRVINTKFEKNVPVFFVGDLNSSWRLTHDDGALRGDRSRIPYCILTENKLLVNAYDNVENKSGHCPSPDRRYEIDHIYSTRDVNISKAGQIRNEETKRASDHDPIFADVSGRSETGGIDGWSWPLQKEINNGPCYGGSNGHAGMDMNSKTTDNPVYAMHKGVVERIGTDVSNDAGVYITIKSTENFNGKPVYYSYEHLKAGSIPKGVRVGVGVVGGQKVGIAGLTGNVNVTGSAAHLHIVTATTNTLGSYGNLGTTFDPMKILKDVKPVPGGYRCY